MNKSKRVGFFLSVSALGCAVVPLPLFAADPAPPPPPPVTRAVEVPAKKASIPKLNPVLNRLYQERMATAPVVGPDAGGPAPADRVDVVIVGKPGRAPALRGSILLLGGTVSGSHGDLVFASVEIARLAQIAALGNVVLVRPPFRSQPHAEGEGVAAHAADLAHAAGYMGQGVKVGVLDCDGFDGYQALLGTDLPATVTLWTGGHGTPVHGTGVHGTACAEIVHEMAPAAQMYIAHDYTEQDYYDAIDWMLAQGVQVISYSCGWIGGIPNDGLGLPHNPINQKAADARAAGVLFVASAGNSGDGDAYTSHFTPCVDPGCSAGDWHDFGDRDGVDWNHSNPIYAYPSGTFVALSWDDWPAYPPLQGSTQDYDLYIFDGAGAVVAGSINLQGGNPGDLPVEQIWFVPPAEGWYYLGIQRYDADGGHFLSLRRSGRGDFWISTPQHSIGSPGESSGVLGVGAIHWNGFALEAFSSRGPTLGPGGTMGGGFLKPDIAGVDAVSTETYGPSDGLPDDQGGTGFFGTSASAPHVAGAAAVLKSMEPSLTAGGLHNWLVDSAVDMGDPGPDNQYGHGRLRVTMAPLPDMDANGTDGPVFTSPATPVEITMGLFPGVMSGVVHDWRVGVVSSYGSFPIISTQTPLHSFNDLPLLNMNLPAGWWLFYQYLDDNPNGLVDGNQYLDSVLVVSGAPPVPTDFDAMLDGVLAGSE